MQTPRANHKVGVSMKIRLSSSSTFLALSGGTSIGWMAIVNFMINSDFKWLLLAFNLPWIVALILSWLKVET
jgi:hypothetical protein